MNYLIALTPAIFWGILPLYVHFAKGHAIQQILGTTIGTLLVALGWWYFHPITVHEGYWHNFFLIFLSGACWTIGQVNQYRAFSQIGVSLTFPISTAMQLVSTILMGGIGFAEWKTTSAMVAGIIAIILMIAGVLFIARRDPNAHNENTQKINLTAGLITLTISTCGYLGYSFFTKFVGSGLNSSDKFLPQALGMVISALVISGFFVKQKPFAGKTVVHLISGFIFSIAALSFIFSIEMNGLATAFTFSQMCVVIATLGGIFILREKKTHFEMTNIMIGLVLVVIGCITIGLGTN